MPVLSSERSPLSSLPSHSNAHYGRGGSRQQLTASSFDEEKDGSESLSGSGGKGLAASGALAGTAAAGPGLGKDRRMAAAGEAAAEQPATHYGGVDSEMEVGDSQQEAGDESAAAGGGQMQVDDASLASSGAPLPPQGGGSASGSHKRKKKGSVGQKRAGIVGAAAASAAAKAERKAVGPLDGVADETAAAAANAATPAPRGGNVQPGQGGTRKRKQKEVSRSSTPQRTTPPVAPAIMQALSTHSSLTHMPLPCLCLRVAIWCCLGDRRRLWWSRATCTPCCQWV